jgi:hypothetical protein
MDGALTPAALHSGRWAQRETLALMERIVALPIESTSGYAVGPQAMALRFVDGTVETFTCQYPPDGETPRSISENKLREASRGRLDADAILDLVLHIEDEPDLRRLGMALGRIDPWR